MTVVTDDGHKTMEVTSPSMDTLLLVAEQQSHIAKGCE